MVKIGSCVSVCCKAVSTSSSPPNIIFERFTPHSPIFTSYHIVIRFVQIPLLSHFIFFHRLFSYQYSPYLPDFHSIFIFSSRYIPIISTFLTITSHPQPL